MSSYWTLVVAFHPSHDCLSFEIVAPSSHNRFLKDFQCQRTNEFWGNDGVVVVGGGGNVKGKRGRSICECDDKVQWLHDWIMPNRNFGVYETSGGYRG